MHKEEFDGLVLFKRQHRDHDALVKLFTPTFGKLMFFVRGVYKPNSPLASQCIPLTGHHYIGQIHEQGLSFIQEGTTTAANTHLRKDDIAFAHGTYIAQLIDAALEDHEVDPLTYQVFKEALTALDEGMNAEIVTIFMEIYLLRLFGIHFEWKQCVICGSQEEPFDLSLIKQGVLCQRHFDKDPYRLHANPRAIHMMKLLSQYRLSQIQSIQVSRDTLQEMKKVIDEIYKEYVGIRLKAKRYLEQIQAQENHLNQLLKARITKHKQTPKD